MPESSVAIDMQTVGVASLNLLLDKGRIEQGLIEPQHERIDSLSRTIGALPVSLDVVMLQEVHATKQHHNGERLAESLGLENSFWFPHNRKDEYLGVCGNAIEWAEAFDVGHNKKAVITMVGEIAFVGIHHRSGIKSGPVRVDQMRAVLHEVESFEKVVLTGDSNDHSRHASRRMLADAGFRSVYKMKRPLPFLPGVLPPTFPTRNYRDILLTPRQRRLLPFGISIDILELRGFDSGDVIQAGTSMTEKSDHRALFAELAF